MARFRFEWKKELLEQEKKFDDLHQDESKLKNVIEFDGSKSKSASITAIAINEVKDLDYEEPKTNEEKAKYLFNKGVLLEQQGRHYEAIKFYRMAMQLDADIEFKVGSTNKQKKNDISDTEKIDDIVTDLNKINLKSEREELSDKVKTELTLFEQFQAVVILDGRFCEKNTQQKVALI